MSFYSTWDIPESFLKDLEDLEGTNLLLKFKMLPWHSFLQDHLKEMSGSNLFNIVNKLKDYLTADETSLIPLFGETSDLKHTLSVAQSMYLPIPSTDRDPSGVIFDMHRAWSAREDEEKGLKSVAEAMDRVMIRKCSAAVARDFARVIDFFGIKPMSGSAERFFDSRARKGKIVSRIIDFWARNVPASTLLGFKGRFFFEDYQKRSVKLKNTWGDEDLLELENLEARDLYFFLTGDASISPSGTATRCKLSCIISEKNPLPVDKMVVKETIAPPPELDLSTLKLDETI